jgi:hypothetical protein
MEDARRRPSVRFRVVENTSAQPVAAQHGRGHFILVGRQRQHPRQPILIQNEAVARQFAGHRSVGQVVVEEIVDPPIDRAGVTGQQPIFFTALSDERLQQRIERSGSTRQRDTGHPHLSQFQIDVPMEIGGVRRIQSNGTSHGLGTASLG